MSHGERSSPVSGERERQAQNSWQCLLSERICFLEVITSTEEKVLRTMMAYERNDVLNCYRDREPFQPHLFPQLLYSIHCLFLLSYICSSLHAATFT